ncbi:MAG TPA: hypothetical protein VN962_24590, partial [Polyangia bacterium]|nr:hypothetical protein [Polyangia bacterium]
MIRIAIVAGILASTTVSNVAGAAGSPLKVQVDKSKVDLKAHRLEVKMSHPAGKVKVEVFADSEAQL